MVAAPYSGSAAYWTQKHQAGPLLHTHWQAKPSGSSPQDLRRLSAAPLVPGDAIFGHNVYYGMVLSTCCDLLSTTDWTHSTT